MGVRVSVCIPLYQKVDHIGRTIDSVLAQTLTDFELVVLDNASTDGSGEVVAAYTDPRIRLVRNETTVPMTENFNLAVGLARAPLVKLLNADDLIEPDALERQVAVMEADPGVTVVSCRHHVVDDDDRIVARDRALRTADLVGRQDRAAVVRRVVRHGGNPVGVPGNMLFRRQAFDAVGGFPEGEPFAIDVALAVLLTDQGAFHGIPETLARFRLAAGSSSSAARGRNLRAQRDFVRGLRGRHADVLRRRDVIQGRVRYPLTWLRHHVIMSASTDPGSATHRLSALLLRGSGRRADRPVMTSA
ncbi:glycosyltransferase family 2 protein [Actinomycetospora lutea]|uniref:glycosyltransferase family 2 protein n=1 Tax=Actinomycetospora lutea TaxID=663604 RepID=UPI002366EE6A|nr:glycosyltransferase family 2 protein [Actinomycetospora lutea]MDD7942862.1 glycosyltransferase family 2 protein [Actinomycetospora lutea]